MIFLKLRRLGVTQLWIYPNVMLHSAHAVVCSRAGCCRAPQWRVWGGRDIVPQGTGSSLGLSRSLADLVSQNHSSWSTGGKWTALKLKSRQFKAQTIIHIQQMYLCRCCSHQAPLANVPADLSRAGRHLAGSDANRAEQTAAECFLQLHSSWTNTGNFPGLVTWTAGDRALQTQRHN